MLYKIIIGIWFSVVIITSFAFPVVQVPKSWYEFPLIPALEDKVRIIFFHVPIAWIAFFAFILSMVYGIKYLKKMSLDDDLKSSSAAGLGLLFCILAVITGSIWAKFSWGSFWNWDPRQTSIFVLLLIYGAYFALRSAVDNNQKRAILSAVYSVIAGVSVPFFIFIMPRIVTSLHPDPIINVEGKIQMSSIMLIVFLASLVGFTALFIWMWQIRIRTARLEEYLKLQGE